MAKYIDAEKLIAEIEKRKRANQQDATESGAGAFYEDKAILQLIDSLQQDKEILELCSQVWWEEQGWIMIPPNVTIKGIDSLLRQVKKKLQQEQSEIDFEEEWEKFEDWVESYNQSDYPTCYGPKQIARHFYELGKKQ